MLEMPDMSAKAEQKATQQKDDDVHVNFVPDYRCTNPRFPSCLDDMRKYPGAWMWKIAAKSAN